MPQGFDRVSGVQASASVDELYRASATPRLVRVPLLRFLCIDGSGDPNTAPAFETAVQALYSVSYTMKFAVKKAGGPQFKVAPLEGLWWAEDMSTFTTGDKSAWDWTLMIHQPDAVTDELVERAAAEVAEKKSLPAAQQLRMEPFEEGAAAQVMHLGPYSSEGPTIARLHDYIREQGFALAGKHHEIYLGDPRRAAPEKLRTIIRQPYTAP